MYIYAYVCTFLCVNLHTGQAMAAPTEEPEAGRIYGVVAVGICVHMCMCVYRERERENDVYYTLFKQ